jgi:hypothetical protein
MAFTGPIISKSYQELSSATGPSSSLRGGTFGFDPRVIPGCILWLDANNPNNVTTSSGNVTLWKDLSVHRVGDLINTANYPTYPGINNDIDFSGSKRLYASAATVGQLSTFDFAIFAVVKVPARPSANIFILSKYTSANVHWELYYTLASTFVFSYTYALSSTKTVTSVACTEGYYVVVSVIAPRLGSMNIYINGVGSTTPATGGSTTISCTGLLRVGSDNTPANFWTSSIGEILMYNSNITSTTSTSVMSSTQQSQIEGYLANKWNITLPTTEIYNIDNASNTLNVPRPFLMPFRPPDIANCKLWLDGADASSISNSGLSTFVWKDKSGLSHDATPLASSKYTGITYTNTPDNPSTNGVLFAQTNSIAGLLNQTAILNVPGVSANYTDVKYENIFVVCSPIDFKSGNQGSTTYDSCLVGCSVTNGRVFSIHKAAVTSVPPSIATLTQIQTSLGGTSRQFTQTTYVGNLYILSNEISTPSTTPLITTYCNGTKLGAGNGGTTPQICNTRLAAANEGAAESYYYRYDGYINEVIIYQSTTACLTNSQRQQVEGYLAWKWGLPDPNNSNPVTTAVTPTEQRATTTSQPLLPTTHPFTNFPSATVVPY